VDGALVGAGSLWLEKTTKKNKILRRGEVQIQP
jgi:hypothetical protein